MAHCRKVVFFLITILSCAFSATNVARGKVVKEVSILCVMICFPGSNLVDGNSATLTWTMHAMNPYLVVDLGQPYQVTTVFIMGDTGTVGALYNVGLSSSSPTSIVPAPSNYKLCSQYIWSYYLPFAPQVTTISCPRNFYPRRWVVYQEITNDDALMVGEMQVNVATRRGTRYERSEGQRVVKDSALIGSPFTVAKRIDCMLPCLYSEDCDSFNFRPSDNSCELHDWDKGVIASTDVSAALDWDLWQPMYSVTEL